MVEGVLCTRRCAIMKNRMITGVIVTLVLLSATFPGTMAETFNVGGDHHWIVPGTVLNYTVWAQNITAHVGDSLYFQYNPNAHDVLKVNSTQYETCNTTNSLQVWDTGDTTVLLQEPGIHYFICGAALHCSKGQAFALDVLPVPSGVAPSGPSVSSPPGKSAAPFTSVVHYWLVTIVGLVLYLTRT